ncbi:TolC family outer membrane protein [Limobrevibacterium gyesilva]|nr:TolC family outer membrane protein [Limobrevibacterium gyesilva]
MRRSSQGIGVLGIGLAAVVVVAAGVPGSARADIRTLQDALALAYSTNPTLLAERANLRATDENVPAALSGWRPQVSISANAGYADGTTINHITQVNNVPLPTPINTRNNALRGTNTQQLTVTQPLYRGGQTRASTNRAENQVIAERARLIVQEQTTFGAVVTAYVNVIQAEQVLALNVNNEQVLTRQLQATNDRFRVGEITRTDVAQAEAALAGATATRETAEGNLATARAQFQQVVGELPGKLIEPQPLRLPTKTLEEAKQLANGNNPAVIAALFDDASAKDNFDLQYSKLMPNLSLQGLLARAEDTQTQNQTTKTAQIVAALTVPIYQGGSEYAAIRQARQQQQQTRQRVDDARRTTQQQIVSAWETYFAAKATIESTRQQVRSNEIALEGVQREAIVGSRTTLDVLNAEQLLLNTRVTLVQNLAALVNASYQVGAAVGRLNARDLSLNVPLYDETAYYKAVRNKWIGTGDYATDQPGR